MRVGPVRITIYNERAVAQVDIRKILRIPLFWSETKQIHEFWSMQALPLPFPSEENPAGSTQSYNRQKTVAKRNLSWAMFP